MSYYILISSKIQSKSQSSSIQLYSHITLIHNNRKNKNKPICKIYNYISEPLFNEIKDDAKLNGIKYKYRIAYITYKFNSS